MKLIKSLRMGRRQFLAAAGVGSASALALGKLSGIMDPAMKTQAAMAVQAAGAASKKGVDYRYPNLLSPIKLRNKVLKNRIFYPVSMPHMLNGPETFPAMVMRRYYANVAKTAGVVTVRFETGNSPRSTRSGDSAHMMIFDLEDYGVQNYICQMIEGIHCMGSLAIGDLDLGSFSTGGLSEDQIKKQIETGNAQVPEGAQGGMPAGQGGAPGGAMQGGEGGQGQMPGGGQGGDAGSGGMPGGGGMPGEMGSTVTEPVDVEKIIEAAKEAANWGLDLVHIAAVRDLSDSVAIENAVKTIEAVKSNTDLVCMMNTPGSGPGGASSDPLKDAVALAKELEGLVDLWRTGGGPTTGFSQEAGDPECLETTEAIKRAGVKTATMASGGLIYPDKNEEYIAKGRCDMIALARPLLSDYDYGKKIYEGRGEDIVPCVLCQKCHGQSFLKDWFSVCSVNPKLGIANAVQVIDAPTEQKTVGIIGGGPAGMKAAITAYERGHKVTLYEKDMVLGGLLRRYSEASSYKWPYKAYMEYLVNQVNKLGIDIKLGTEATPEMIKKKSYDVVMMAIGDEAKMPNLPGADAKNVYNVVDVFGKHKELGKSVVFIGAGEFGTESAIYLAKEGIDVTIMTPDEQIIVNDRPHGPNTVISVYRSMKNFTSLTQVIPKKISGGKVTYTDTSGKEASVKADSVVIFGGLKAKQDEAMTFDGTAKKAFYLIGDCTGNCGNIQKTTRSAFFAASQV
jgi:2,4-dienoyl-CoA reductase-like NADH-dependent reductase (Old Yellow Enzyme family)/thioredoxin reductase